MRRKLEIPSGKLFAVLADIFAQQAEYGLARCRIFFQQHGGRVYVGKTVTVCIPLRTGEVEIDICLRAVTPGTAYAGKHVAHVSVGITVRVYPVIDAVRAPARHGAFSAADGVDGGNNDATMRLFQIPKGIHDGGASVTVTDEHDISMRVYFAESCQVSAEFPCAVEQEIAGAAVPCVIGSQLGALAGQERHFLV